MGKRLASVSVLVVAICAPWAAIAQPATETHDYGRERRYTGYLKSDAPFYYFGQREAASTHPEEIPPVVTPVDLRDATVSPDPSQIETAIAQAGPPFYHVWCGAEYNVWTGQTKVGCTGASGMVWMLAYTQRTGTGYYGNSTLILRSRVTFWIPPAPPGRVVQRAELQLLVPAVPSGGQWVPVTGTGATMSINGKPFPVKNFEYGYGATCADNGALQAGSGWVARVAWDFTEEVAALAASQAHF